MLRWALVLVPLLGCGLMCFGGVVIAALGFRRATGTRERACDTPAPTAAADTTAGEHVDV
jgi:hypothetical protein